METKSMRLQAIKLLGQVDSSIERLGGVKLTEKCSHLHI